METKNIILIAIVAIAIVAIAGAIFFTTGGSGNNVMG